MIKENIDWFYCIFFFEQEFYVWFGYEVDYVGYLLVDVVCCYCEKLVVDLFKVDDLWLVIVLFLGSWKQEISKKLFLMFQVVEDIWKDYCIVIVGVLVIDFVFYQFYLG